MELLFEGLKEAIRLIRSLDPLVLDATWRSLQVSCSAVALAGICGLALGSLLGRFSFPGRSLVVALSRAGMSIPTVLIGLLGYAMFSRRGPLGSSELLYTTSAVVVGEFFLALPIIVTWTQGAVRKLDSRVVETARTLGAGPLRRWLCYLSEARLPISLAFLTAFARCFTELGVAMMLGGNIKEKTRTLATATALETSRGDFARGLAMSLIIVAFGLLITIAMTFLNRQKAEFKL